MNSLECEIVRDLLPEWKAGLLDAGEAQALEQHLATCHDCGESLAVLEALLKARPEPPRGLEARIKARVRQEVLQIVPEERDRDVLPMVGRRRWVPVWVLSAAAVLLLALGANLFLKSGGFEAEQDPILVAVQEPLPEAWLWDDGIVAGAPVFEGLSDEDLEALLKEWEG